jgi:hypothetical protein
MRGFEDMKIRSKILGKKELQLIPRLPLLGLPAFPNTYTLFNYFPRAFKLSQGINDF